MLERETKARDRSVKVSLIQPAIVPDDDETFKRVEDLVKKTVYNDKPDIIVLPERWKFINPFKGDVIKRIDEERGVQYGLVQSWAEKFEIPIVSGAIWEFRKGYEKPFITSYFFNAEGKEVGRQDKINLYLAEQKFFNSGKELVIFPFKNTENETLFRFSVLICFDLHASGDFIKMAVNNGAEIIFSPTLIRKKGEENWGIYLRARALETRTPIVSVNSIHSFDERVFRGKSKFISFKRGSTSPVMLDIRECGTEPGHYTSRIDLSFPGYLRKKRLGELTDPSSIGLKILE